MRYRVGWACCSIGKSRIAEEGDVLMKINQAVILAGGKGSRIRRRYKNVLKVMLPINGKPILQRNIEILRDQLNIRSILIIVGYKDEVIKKYFKDGKDFEVEIDYINSNPNDGIADALLLAKGKVGSPFVIILGDEVYLNSNHSSLNEAKYKDADGIVAFIHKDNPQDIANNYSMRVNENMLISSLIEKPQKIENDLLGLGTFVLTDVIFNYIEATKVNFTTKRKELIDAISNMAKECRVYAHELTGFYININTRDDWHFAQYLVNQHSFQSTKKSLVIPTYNENESISFVLKDFKDVVDEIIVADGGSTDGTIEKVTKLQDECNIKLIRGNFAGYGDSIRSGIEATTGEIIVLVEGDATFRSRDIYKMYEYIKDCDMVIGTRTTKQLICQGANMKYWLRIGNVLAGKVIELLWIKSEPRFTDVGCTYRTFWKSTYDELKHNFVGVGPEFSPEMMVEFIRNNKRVIEIPVSYYNRIGGVSKHSRKFWGVFKTAMRMMFLVLKKRFSKY